MRSDERKPRWTFIIDGRVPTEAHHMPIGVGSPSVYFWASRSRCAMWVAEEYGEGYDSVVIDADELALCWEAQAGSWE